MSSIFTKRLLLATTIIAGLAVANPAYAQDLPPENDPAPVDPTPQEPVTDVNAEGQPVEGEQDIVVTGSRIARPNLTSTVPVNVMDEQILEGQGLENFADIAQTQPQFAPAFGASRTQSTFSGAATSGLNTVNLRNLGSVRTLVLINGRRVPGGTSTSTAVDFNTITTANVERIEVITGGASAVYGTDAVAGVINIITKQDFEGLEIGASYGIAEHGDNENPSIYAMYGANIGDGGNVNAVVQYDFQGEVMCRNRFLCAEDILWTVPDNFIRGPGARSGVPLGGRFLTTNGPATGFTRDLETGEFVPFVTAEHGFNRNPNRHLAIPTHRLLTAISGRYPIMDNLNLFVEFNYGQSRTNASFEAQPFQSNSPGNLVGGAPGGPPALQANIPVTNPFIPAEILSTVGATQTEIVWLMRFAGLADRGAKNERATYRFAGGFNGDFNLLGNSPWRYEVAYIHGRTRLDSLTKGLVGTDRLYHGLRVEPDPLVPGGFRCIDPVARASGCVPVNPFAPFTDEQAQWLNVSAGQTGASKLNNLVAYTSGDLFELPAGGVGVSVGAEYRSFAGNLDYDDVINQGLITSNIILDTENVKTSVRELFGEVIVPVVRDLPFAHSLTLEGAYRISDPNRGKNYNTWRYGGTWEPIDSLRFRAARARAIRAPTPGELSGAGQTFGTVVDPCSASQIGATPTRAANCAAAGVPAGYVPPQLVAQGVSGFITTNPNVEPEEATTLTYGAVFTPRFIPGLSLTVDRFDIEAEGIISTIGRQTIVNNCYDTGQFCDLVTRGPSPFIVGNHALLVVNDTSDNLASVKVKGWDVEARYAMELGRILGGDPGRLTLQAIGTKYDKATIQATPTSAVVDLEGVLGGTPGGDTGYPDWTAAFNAFYDSSGPFGLNYNLRYISSGIASPGLTGFPKISDAFYHNARASWDIGETYQFYFGVNNIFDNDPPFFPTSTTGSQALETIPAYYDVFGRSYYAGVKLNF